MGKAIAAASILVFCSFAFVFVQLWFRRPSVPPQMRGAAPPLENREDGSVYAISIEMDKFERRLMEEEKRWEKLNEDLATMRTEREELKKALEDAQGDIRRLRRQVNERPAPPTRPRPTPPPVVGPETPPVTPETESSVTPVPPR
jgi:septal ring factor EnvC (AmiA/AmiB activator)